MEKFKQGTEEQITNDFLMEHTPKSERWLKKEEVEVAMVLLMEGKTRNEAIKQLREESDMTFAMAIAATKAAEAIDLKSKKEN